MIEGGRFYSHQDWAELTNEKKENEKEITSWEMPVEHFSIKWKGFSHNDESFKHLLKIVFNYVY